jgi:hypothetical protein
MLLPSPTASGDASWRVAFAAKMAVRSRTRTGRSRDTARRDFGALFAIRRERSQAPPTRPRVAAPSRVSGEQGPVRLRGLRPEIGRRSCSVPARSGARVAATRLWDSALCRTRADGPTNGGSHGNRKHWPQATTATAAIAARTRQPTPAAADARPRRNARATGVVGGAKPVHDDASHVR